MPVLYENLTKAQADLCNLILSSAGITFKIIHDKGGFSIWVDDSGYPHARQTMESYFQENKADVFPDNPLPMVSPGAILSGVIAGFILLIFYTQIAGTEFRQEILHQYGASAKAIIQGDLYRSVTALTLHGDMMHLAGNMLGFMVFGTAVSAICGWGVGWLMIVTSGVVGNLINAYVHESGHISIGASTAVFGAIGILSGFQWVRRRRFQTGRAAAWAPLTSGLALLGLLGSGPHSDLGAHFFGFGVGISMGLVYAIFVLRPLKIFFQMISVCLIVLCTTMAWMSP